MPEFSSRLASPADVPALTDLMDAAIVELQAPSSTTSQIVSSDATMGIDTQLIDDERCFGVESGCDIVAAVVWSRRATLDVGPDAGRDSTTCSTRPSTRRAFERCTKSGPCSTRCGQPDPFALRGTAADGSRDRWDWCAANPDGEEPIDASVLGG